MRYLRRGEEVVLSRLPHRLPFSSVRSPPHSTAVCRLKEPIPVSASSLLVLVVGEDGRSRRLVGAAVETHLEAAEEPVILGEGGGVTLEASVEWLLPGSGLFRRGRSYRIQTAAIPG